MAEITEIKEALSGESRPFNIMEKLGETVYDFIQMDDNSTYDIGRAVFCVITDCETQQELDMASNMLEAICGCNLDNVLATIKERDLSGYEWLSLG